MKTYSIAVIPGDGTGPEVIGEGLKVLKAAAKKFKFGLKTKVFPFGGKHYLETGKLVDEAVRELGGRAEEEEQISSDTAVEVAGR